ncbi:Spy/CpxP family protein refolding chaperone [Acidisoma cellulosilytica]|uniref:Spy/CpxP family protein refolding chaperone n=1 Tax=Acidisoma cellulosilyticum TaxID=2802395 RepID=A0A963YZN2_9PROT|nr:Spy/CpxP family protein refolding chaperone [Acidisoma cellulosilyticum]MCB8879312.1 Spy/CpxP family protein refolding chaperone [Acidisoma cellulosilyticum]
MKFTAPASPRLVLALGLAAVCGLGPVRVITAAHAQTTPAPAAATAPAAASPTTPAEVPAPSKTSPTASATGAAHRHGSQALNTYLTALHQDLKITADQETQWTAFADSMRDNAATLGQAYRTRRQQLPTMDATQDLSSFIQVEQLRLDGLKKSSDAFSALYAVMPAEQKKVADAVFLSDLPGGPRHKAPAKGKTTP